MILSQLPNELLKILYMGGFSVQLETSPSDSMMLPGDVTTLQTYDQETRPGAVKWQSLKDLLHTHQVLNLDLQQSTLKACSTLCACNLSTGRKIGGSLELRDQPF